MKRNKPGGMQKNPKNMQQNKPDDRSDNVERIQRNINYTIQNMELADELMAKTSDSKSKQDLAAKNERRRQSLDSMRREIKDEADYKNRHDD